MPTPLSSPGVFNVLDPWYFNGSAYVGMLPGDNSVATAAQNTAVLNAIIALAQTTTCGTTGKPPYGAIILFPGHDQVPSPGSNGEDTGTWQGAEYFLTVSGVAEYAAFIDCDNPLRFLGTGNVKLSMIPDNSNSLGDIFYLDIAGNNPGGVTFENITFHYDAVDESTEIPQYCAIRSQFNGAENCRVLRCVFEDCPIGVWFSEALECSILECRFEYANNAGIAVKLGSGENSEDSDTAKEIYITDCVFNGGNIAHGGSTEPAGSTAIWMLATDHVRVTNAQIDSFQNGIYIAPKYLGACIRAQFTACGVYTGTDADNEMGSAVFIQPQLSGASISQILFEGCYFELGETATPRADVAGILIDAQTNEAFIDTIRFASCHSLRWSGQGLRILGFVDDSDNTWPANVEILGGMYAGNRYHDGTYTSVDPYGIWLGNSTGVRIVGVNCIGQYEWITLGSAPVATLIQHVGILVDDGAEDIIISGCDIRNNVDYGVQVQGGASNVVIDACDLRGNGTNGVFVDGSAAAVSGIYIRNCNTTGYSGYSVAINISSVTSNQASVQVTNCAGYNDAQADLGTTVSDATAFHGYGFGYWGPIEFYAANSMTQTITVISVNGHTTPLKTGSFYLQPGESAEITWTPGTAPINFLALGK